MEDKYETHITSNGSNFYYKNGKSHRDDDLPAIEFFNGNKEWYIEGRLHRIDGPALIWKNKIKWFYEGKEINCSNQKDFERIINLNLFW